MRLYLAGIALVFVSAFCTALGWLFGSSGLLAFVNDGTLMQMNTALCFLCLTSALGFRLVGNWAALLTIPTVAFGFLTLFEYAAGLNLGIDKAFIPHHVMPGIIAGRMGLNTALSFVLLSTPLYYSRGHFIARACIIGALFLSTVGLFGYVLGIDKLYTWGSPIGIGMSLTTALSLLVLGGAEYIDRFSRGGVS